MKTYIKTIILIFSMVVSCLCVASLITYECATTVNCKDCDGCVQCVCAYTVRACVLGILECHKNSVQSVYRF